MILWDVWCVCYRWIADILRCVSPVRENEDEEREKEGNEDIPRHDYRTYGTTVYSFSDIKHL